MFLISHFNAYILTCPYMYGPSRMGNNLANLHIAELNVLLIHQGNMIMVIVVQY